MGKKSKRKTKSAPHTRTGKHKSTFLRNNLIVSVIVIIFLSILYNSVPGYKWLFDSLVVNNLQFILKNPNLSLQQKYEAKLGFDARFVNYVKDRTPQDAVILMPDMKEFYKADFNTKGSWGVKAITWSTYFLYPRKLIYEKNCETYPELCSAVSHVMIVNQWGYDKLQYQVDQKYKHNILPIRIVENLQ